MVTVELNSQNRCFRRAMIDINGYQTKNVGWDRSDVQAMHRKFEQHFKCEIVYKVGVYPWKLTFENDEDAIMFLLKYN